MIIYLIAVLLQKFSGLYRTPKRATYMGTLLAADRVYLLCKSPYTAVGSYPTRFIFSPTMLG